MRFQGETYYHKLVIWAFLVNSDLCNDSNKEHSVKQYLKQLLSNCFFLCRSSSSLSGSDATTDVCLLMRLVGCNYVLNSIFSVHGCVVLCGAWAYKGFSNKGNSKNDKEPNVSLVYKDLPFTISSLSYIVGLVLTLLMILNKECNQ